MPRSLPAQSILDAIRAQADRFVFEGTEIPLKRSAMTFITMNPGYIGRAELPESLKVSGQGALDFLPFPPVFEPMCMCGAGV